jgi:hypothetical protein
MTTDNLIATVTFTHEMPYTCSLKQLIADIENHDKNRIL